MLIFPFIEDGFVFFTWGRGISLSPREKKNGIYGYCSCLPVKGTFFPFLRGQTIQEDSPFFKCARYLHSVCNEKLQNDLIKVTHYTPDYLGSTKNDDFQKKT